MRALTRSAVCSGLLVATNGFSHFTNTNLVTISAVWLVLALGLIVVSTASFCVEVTISLHALGMAVKHLPKRNHAA